MQSKQDTKYVFVRNVAKATGQLGQTPPVWLGGRGRTHTRTEILPHPIAEAAKPASDKK